MDVLKFLSGFRMHILHRFWK